MRVVSTELSLEVEDAPRARRSIHPLWLRERSTEPSHLDRRTEQRLYNPSDLDPDIAIVSIEPLGGDGWRIRFSDGHSADYAAASILAESAMAPGQDGIPRPEPWRAALRPLPIMRWPASPTDRDLLEACRVFLRLGFVILSDVPSTHHAVLDVARRFGHVRDTNFGVVFDVRSVPDASDLAYTSLALEPHTDNPYRSPVPGVQLLHCLNNRTSGGLSTLVDGIAVAEALAAEDPDAFQALAETEVRFRYVDATTEHVAWAPLIECGSDGKVRGLHISPRLDFVPLLAAAELARFYQARRRLDRMLKSADFEVRFRLDDGDLVMFDNARCLHGRTSFALAEGERHLQGCYIDIDGPRSLYRVLAGRLDRR